MDVRHRTAQLSRARTYDDGIGYNEAGYPWNQYWRIHSNGKPNPDCGAFTCWNDHDALLEAGIDIGNVYYEPTGSYYPTDCGIMHIYDMLPYADYRNEVGDNLVSNGHTVKIVSVKEENGLGYDEISHAATDLDGVCGDSSGREVRTEPLYDGGWNWILRIKDEYNKEIGEPEPAPTNKFAYGELTELWPCKKGDEGGHVITLQAVLHSKYDCYDGDIDGDFGSMTDAAVKKFQEMAGLYVDGQCGAKTWYTLLCSNVVL